MQVEIGNRRLTIAFGDAREFETITNSLTIRVFDPTYREYFPVTYWKAANVVSNPPIIKVRTGLLDHVLRVATKNQFPLQVIDKLPQPSGQNVWPHAQPQYELRPYQKEATAAAIRHRQGLLAIGMGGGKSLNAADVMREAGYPSTLIVVSLSVLVDQLRKEIANGLGLDPYRDIGTVGGGSTGQFKPVTIATAQSLQRMIRNKRRHLGSSVLSHFEMLIVDEAHRGIDRSGEILDAMDNVHWVFGLTGTPKKTRASKQWEERLYDITAVFGPVISRVSPLELVQEGYTSIPIVRFADYESYCPVDRFLTYADYINYLKHDRIRNEALAEIAMCAVRNQYPTLIYVEHEDHVDALSAYMPRAEIVTGSRRNPTLKDRIQKGEVNLAIATSTWREGVNASRIQHVMRVAPGKDSTNQDQESQRGNRLKEDGSNFYFVTEMLDRYSACEWARKHTRERQKNYSLHGWPVYTVDSAYRSAMFDRPVVDQYLQHVKYVLSTRPKDSG